MIKKPSKMQLHAQFERFNVQHFGGFLPLIPVHWCYMRQHGEWDPPYWKNTMYPKGRIILSSMSQPKCGWRGVLLHEMIHAALFHSRRENGEDEPSVHEDHDEAFQKECNRIGKKLGLEEVSVGECWSWPWTSHDADDLEEWFE